VRERIEEAVDGLPEIYRTVFLMHDLEGFSHGEIAEALGVAEGTSKARLSRARSRLRETLGPAMQEYVG
jgi:RNA polymerase sigma-70 factor (ECF subfamily)